MENTLTDLAAVLAYLAGPAGVGAWMVYVSQWFRNAVDAGTLKLDKLESWKLQLIVGIVSVLPPAIAYIILAVVPPETLALAAPTYRFVAVLFLGYLAQQGWFALTKPNTTTKVTVSAPAPAPDASGESKTGPINVSVGASSTSPSPESNRADLSVG